MNDQKDKISKINNCIGQYTNIVSKDQNSYTDYNSCLIQNEFQQTESQRNNFQQSEFQQGESQQDDFQKRKKIKVLIVDDNTVNRFVAKNLLNLLDVTVKEASSANEAMKLMKHEKYNLILIDYLMPNIDGLELTRWIQKTFDSSNKPIIIGVSGKIDDEIRQNFNQAGAYELIKKPIEIEILNQILKDLFPQFDIENTEMKDIVKEEVEYNRNASDDRAENICKLVSKIPGIDYEKGLHYAIGDALIYLKIIKVSIINIRQCIERMNKFSQDIRYLELKKEYHSIKSVLMHIGATNLADEASRMELNIDNNLTINYSQIMNFVEKLTQLLTALEHAIDAYTIIDSKENHNIKKGSISNKETYEIEKKERKQVVLYHAKRFEYELMLENLKELLPLTNADEEEKVKEMILAAERFDYNEVIKLIREISVI